MPVLRGQGEDRLLQAEYGGGRWVPFEVAPAVARGPLENDGWMGGEGTQEDSRI